jgi:hypothetical protein
LLRKFVNTFLAKVIAAKLVVVLAAPLYAINAQQPFAVVALGSVIFSFAALRAVEIIH